MPTIETVPQTVTHTPGPWTRHRYEAAGEVAANGDRPAYTYRDLTIGSGKTIVATVPLSTLPADWSGYPQVHDEAELEANARLIMAAPELLDALNGLVGLIQLLPDRDQRESLQRNHRYVEACAVLAKAEGLVR
jgi:hypothetical protein